MSVSFWHLHGWPRARGPHRPGPKARLLAGAGLAASVAAGLIAAPGTPAVAQVTRTAATKPAATVWLCRPGSAPDPCAPKLAMTVDPKSGATSVRTGKVDTASKFDCFYLYPTVSNQSTPNSNLAVQQPEILAAKEQAAWFSTVCRVWSPMYRQVTTTEIVKPGLTASSKPVQIAYRSLLSGFENYLRYHNDGRPIIFVAHSQGSIMLIRLMQNVVEHDAVLRHRIVLSIILGGNVVVRNGSTEGGSFASIPVCTNRGETGCVLAYSSFPGEPPAASVFGRPGKGISVLTGQTARKGVHVACTNPADIGGGGLLDPYMAAGSTQPTFWAEYPHLYAAHCVSQGGATWLQVSKATGPKDTRPVVQEILGPDWGYHPYDVNLELGDLLRDTASAERQWTAEHRER